MSKVGILGALLCACGGYREHPGHGPDDSCADVDADGWGVGPGCAGPDCDDANVAVWDAADCEAICDADPHGRGCACDATESTEPETCYGGPPETMEVGPCQAGLRQCIRGRWTPCNHEVLPQDEVCDGVDQDCDGVADEGLLNECGLCGECFTACVGRGEECAPWDVAAEGLGAVYCDASQDCVTVAEPPANRRVAWIPNTATGTISRIDTETHAEVGRYATSALGISDAPSPAPTSVDWTGAVVVVNRAFGGQSSVTKISADCADVDGDGIVETSSGREDVKAWGEDECVEWSTDVGGVGSTAHAVATEVRVGLDGVIELYAWVGLRAAGEYVEIDSDGELTGTETSVGPCEPYMAAIDRDDRVWSSCQSATLTSFDALDPSDVEIYLAPDATYGIAIDPNDGRVWTGGGACTVFDPDTLEFLTVPGCDGQVPLADGDGTIWMSGGDVTSRIDVDTLEVTVVDAESHGLAIDFEGMVWGIPSTGTVDLIDPVTNDVERILDDCGGPCLDGPIAYGDMTGYVLVNHVPGAASYTHLFEGCESTTVWRALTWDATLAERSVVSFAVRAADSLADLAIAPRIEVGLAPPDPSPISFDASGRFLEVEAVLHGELGDPPLLYSFGVQWQCGP